MLVTVATLGNRDLLAVGRWAEEWAKADDPAEHEALGSCRAMGKTVCEDFERYRDGVSMPILEPLLQFTYQLSLLHKIALGEEGAKARSFPSCI